MLRCHGETSSSQCWTLTQGDQVMADVAGSVWSAQSVVTECATFGDVSERSSRRTCCSSAVAAVAAGAASAADVVHGDSGLWAISWARSQLAGTVSCAIQNMESRMCVQTPALCSWMGSTGAWEPVWTE